MEVSSLKDTTLQDLIENIFHGVDNKVITVLDNQPDIKTQENMTTLAKAAIEAGSKDILLTLLEHGLKITDALNIIITSDKEAMMDLVLDKVADKKTKKYVLNECVYFAVKANKKDIISNLLKRGANINTNQREKNTPLHTAIIEKCEVDVLKHLIDNEANTKLTNKKNKSALDLVNDFLDNSENDTEEKVKLEKMKNLLIDKDYEISAGGPSVLSGFSYQIKYLTLYAIINTKLATRYEISTEAMDLIPFDDIHLKRTQGGRTRCEFVQVKQGKVEQYNFFAMLNNNKNIKEYMKGNDSIVKMFIKFNTIMNNPMYKNTSTEFIYCMNGNFQNESSPCFKQISMTDNDLLCGVRRENWTIDPKYLFIEIKYVILNLIATSLYFTIMTDEIKNEVNEQIEIINNFIKGNLIEVDLKHLCNVKTISKKGLNGIREYLTKYETKTCNTNDEKNMNVNFSDACELTFKNGLLKKESIMKLESDKDIFLFFSKYDECEIKKKIDNFVKHFRVFTNCPSSDELDEIIGQEIKGEFKVEIPKLITAFCIKYVSEWISNFKKGKLPLFSDSHGKKLFNNIRIQIFNEFNKTYIEELQRGNIRFEQTNEQVKNFLNGENNQILHVITQYTHLHAINIMQILKTLKCLDEHSIFCDLGRILKSIDNLKTIFDGFSSNDSNNLYIFECADDESHMQHIYFILNFLKNIITSNARKKIIIIAGYENKLIEAIKGITNTHISFNSTLAFEKLTRQSQEMILNKTIHFINNPNSVKTSMRIKDFIPISTAREVIDENILSAIVTNIDGIQIGNDKAFISDNYNSELYIPRHMVGGNITTPNINKLLPQNITDKIVIVANHAGEGKSTMLTHLAHCMRNKSENCWIIRIDLRNYTDNKLCNSLNSITYSVDDTPKAIEHIARMVVQTNSAATNITLERELLREILNKCNRIGVILLIDGFDEISPNYKEKTCIMLKALAKSDITQLWVTTRSHLKQYLEWQLQVTAYSLCCLTETEQIQFLCNFWNFHLKNNKFTREATEEGQYLEILQQQRILMHNLKHITHTHTLENTDKNLQSNLLLIKNVIDDETTLWSLAERSLELWEMSMTYEDFLKIPLYLEMFANNFMQREWKLIFSRCKQFELFEIYTEFIENKLEIYCERSTTRRGNQHAMDQADMATILFRKMHREIAVKTLFDFSNVSKLPVLPDLSVCSEHSNYIEMLIRAGLVKSSGDSVEFIHRTFAEYFFSEYLVTHLEHTNVQYSFLSDVLLRRGFNSVRYFFDRFLFKRRLLLQSANDQRENILTQNITKLIMNCNIFKETCENILHIAVFESNVDIFLLIIKNISKKAFVKLIMQKYHYECSMLDLCVAVGHVDMFNTLVECIKELSIPIKTNLKTLIKQPFHNFLAPSSSSLVNHPRQRSVLRDQLMICDSCGETVLHTSLRRNYSDISEKLIVLAKSFSVLEKLIKTISYFGSSVLHCAVSSNNLDNVRIILTSIEENSEVLKDIISQADEKGRTALHLAIFYDNNNNNNKRNNLQSICEIIIKTAEKYDELLKDLIMKHDNEGRTALHVAVYYRKNEICSLLLKTVENHEYLHKYLITHRDVHGDTALDIAGSSGQAEISNLILESAIN